MSSLIARRLTPPDEPPSGQRSDNRTHRPRPVIVARGTAYVRAAGGGAAAARVRPSATGMRMRQSYMGPMMNVRRATAPHGFRIPALALGHSSPAIPSPNRLAGQGARGKPQIPPKTRLEMTSPFVARPARCRDPSRRVNPMRSGRGRQSSPAIRVWASACQFNPMQSGGGPSMPAAGTVALARWANPGQADCACVSPGAGGVSATAWQFNPMQSGAAAPASPA